MDRSGYYNIQYRLQCRGRGVERTRRRMREHRDVTRYLLGTRDPFGGITESDVFEHGIKVYERVIVIPKPDIVRVGILNEGMDRLPEHPIEEKTIHGLTSKLLAQQKMDDGWICAELDLQQLNAFLMGMSEYLCNDLGLRDMRETSSHSILFPADNPLRLSWQPGETKIELVKDAQVYQKSLTSGMLQEIEAICDGLIQKSDALVHLAPPLPLYLSNSHTPQQKTSILWSMTVVLMVLGSCLGVFYRAEAEQLLHHLKKSAETKIADVIERKYTK